MVVASYPNGMLLLIFIIISFIILAETRFVTEKRRENSVVENSGFQTMFRYGRGGGGRYNRGEGFFLGPRYGKRTVFLKGNSSTTTTNCGTTSTMCCTYTGVLHLYKCLSTDKDRADN